ncbi:hypothetical protein PT974_11734 [Cladobotryum mycophilum]|uniref:AA1-like domain-containing protein n=1 Tax=Cladobotryum mycophilum TaxID=491253 RepID=A0ABR0S6Y0_9HYPO
MRFEPIRLLALVPSAVSAMSFAGLSYRPSNKLVAIAEANGCTFPGRYHVKDFIGQSNSTGSTAVLSSYNFTFEDAETNTTTFCQWNTSSVSTTPSGLTPRFPCENHDIKFIWEDDKRELTPIERFCPNADGKPTTEVSGSIAINLVWGENQACAANSTDIEGRYYSIGPVIDPTFVKRGSA